MTETFRFKDEGGDCLLFQPVVATTGHAGGELMFIVIVQPSVIRKSNFVENVSKTSRRKNYERSKFNQ